MMEKINSMFNVKEYEFDKLNNFGNSNVTNNWNNLNDKNGNSISVI